MRFLSLKFDAISYCADYEMIICIAVFLPLKICMKRSFSADIICCMTDDYDADQRIYNRCRADLFAF